MLRIVYNSDREKQTTNRRSLKFSDYGKKRVYCPSVLHILHITSLFVCVLVCQEFPVNLFLFLVKRILFSVAGTLLCNSWSLIFWRCLWCLIADDYMTYLKIGWIYLWLRQSSEYQHSRNRFEVNWSNFVPLENSDLEVFCVSVC